MKMNNQQRAVCGLAAFESRTLRARWIFPVSSLPIANGLVAIDGGRIIAVGPTQRETDVEDLGNVAIIPGLVNAHTHLEFSSLSRPLGEPGMEFIDWLRLVVQYRQQALPSSNRSVATGLAESERFGIAALGEISQPCWPMEQMETSHLDVTVFLELISPTVERIPDAVSRSQSHLQLAQRSTKWQAGLSPHAPYSVHPELLSRLISLSAARHAPIAMHLAESREELELLHEGKGPLRQFLQELGVWRPGVFQAGMRPLDYLRALAAAHRTAIIHGNFLDEEEILFLGAHADRMAVVYCPRTHAYFRRAPYPLEKMLDSGVIIALGTDSRASSPDLSILNEMRQTAKNHPQVKPESILRMATFNGARALGRETELGTLEPGKKAVFTIIKLPCRDAADPHELLLDAG
jgi:aminodeoxyfutalosine deaminase